MSELDPRLVELLRRSPAPVALDETHRAAVATAARQAWFRAQAARRRSLVATILAACLVAGLCGFVLRGAFDTPSVPVVMPLATADHPRSEPPAGFAEQHDVQTLAEDRETPRQQTRNPRSEEAAQPAPTAFGSSASTPTPSATPAAPPAITTTQAPTEPTARRARETRRGDNKTADVMARAAMEVKPAQDEPLAMEAGPGGMVAAAAPAPAAEQAPGALDIPADAPERGRLLAAAIVLDAAQSGRLAGGDRTAALRAALASLNGLAHPAAERLRGELRSALAPSR